MQVGTFSASSGLDIWLLPNFLPFHVHALLLNPWATKKLLCEQFIQPAIFPPFVTALSLTAAPFLTPELGSDICAWHWGGWGGEWGRSWGVRVEESKFSVLRSETWFCCCSCQQKNSGICQVFHGDSGLQRTANREKCSCRQEGGVWCGYLRKGLWRRINCITATSKLICSL